jgi:hypothetical protein
VAAVGANPRHFPPKVRCSARPKSTLRLQWVPCARILDGAVARLVKSSGVDCFATVAEARTAEEQYFKERGYRNEVVYCDVCRALHVKHVYSSEIKSAKPVAWPPVHDLL